MADKKHFKFAGKIVFVGFGSVAQGVLPLLLRHIDMPKERISIITAHDRGRAEAESFGIRYEINPLTRENFRAILSPRLDRGDFLINLSVDVASAALIEFCCEKGVLYLDSCIEPWAGGYTDQSVSASRRSNSCSAVVISRLPVEPTGWPSAIDPPLTLTLSTSSSSDTPYT